MHSICRNKVQQEELNKKGLIPLSDRQVNSIQQIHKLLSCCKCNEVLQQPYHLKCDHIICQSCFDSAPKTIIVCPVCKKRSSRKDIHFDPLYSNLSSHFETIKETQPSIDMPDKSSVPLSVFGIKRELNSKSPICNPIKVVDQTHQPLEIISDSSNDAFTYMCCNPQVCLPSTPSKNQSNEMPSKSSKKRIRIHADSFPLSDYMIITSSLSDKMMEMIRSFASQHNIIWKSEFPFQVHQIDGSVDKPLLPGVDSIGKKSHVHQKFILIIRHQDGWCKRTVKYLYALACGAWIVGVEWIEDCLAAGRVLDPIDYEIKGDSKTKVMNAPRSSRIDHEKGNHGIFNNVFFIMRVQDSRNGIPINILIDLLQRCGCVKNVQDVSLRGKGMRIMEVVERFTAQSGLDVVTVDMLLNCIGSWKGL